MENHVILILLLVIGNIAWSCHAVQLDETHDSSSFDEIKTPEETNVPKQIDDNSGFCLSPDCISEETYEFTRYKEKEPHVLKNGPGVCMTTECAFAAIPILRNMDTSVNPCDDFYSFACGNYNKSRLIPKGMSHINILTDISNTISLNLRRALETKNKYDLEIFKKLKNYYDVCMDEDFIEKQGKGPLLKVLNELGGWPVLLGDKWDENSFKWFNTAANIDRRGFPASAIFLGVRVMPDVTNTSKLIIQIERGYLELTDENVKRGWNDEVVLAYFRYMVELAVLLGADEEQVTAELRDMLKFELMMTHVALEEIHESGNYKAMTIRQLNEKFPTVPWKEFLNKLVDPILKLSDDYVINVASPKFIADLLYLLDATPKRVQANFALWRVITNAIRFSTKDIRKAELKYLSYRGLTRDVERWKKCVNDASESMTLAIGSLYVRNYFFEDAKRHAVELVSEIRDAVGHIVKKINWMDDPTKESALEKMDAMVAHIAYPDELLDDHKIEKFYAGLKINSTNYLEVAMSVSRFTMEHRIKRLRKPFNKTDWVDHGDASDVNPFYAPTENSIRFPAGVLQGAFFNNARPKYLNYGGIGSVVAHEITHAFDYRGRSFDKYGNSNNWWPESVYNKFVENAKCMIDQCNNYVTKQDKRRLDGVNTLSENFGDNVGIEAAYLAYKKWVNRNGAEPQLPGLDYTGQQMFWIGNANVWCTKYTPQALRELIRTDNHSPAEYRVNGPLSNRPEFAKDFSCPVGSKMNPVRKCSVW